MTMSFRPTSFHCANTICDSVAMAFGVSFFCVASCGRLPAKAADDANGAKRAASPAPSATCETQCLRFIDALLSRSHGEHALTMTRGGEDGLVCPANEREINGKYRSRPALILRRKGVWRHAKSRMAMRAKLTCRYLGGIYR